MYNINDLLIYIKNPYPIWIRVSLFLTILIKTIPFAMQAQGLSLPP